MLIGDVLYLDNGTVKVGMKLTWGGVISELWYNGAQLVDDFDPGLEIQAAYYAGGERYSSRAIGTTPIGDGTRYKAATSTIAAAGSSPIPAVPTPFTSEHAPSNGRNKGGGSGQSVRSTVTLEQWVTVSGRVVYLDYGLQNDGTPRAAADQEVPSFSPTRTSTTGRLLHRHQSMGGRADDDGVTPPFAGHDVHQSGEHVLHGEQRRYQRHYAARSRRHQFHCPDRALVRLRSLRQGIRHPGEWAPSCGAPSLSPATTPPLARSHIASASAGASGPSTRLATWKTGCRARTCRRPR